MKNHHRILLTALVFCLAGASALAAELKIAVIDMDKAFQDYFRTKIVDASLKQQSEIYQGYIRKRNESLLKLEEQFKKLRDASQSIALSETERETKRFEAQKKYREIQEIRTDLEQYTKEKGTQFNELQQKKREEILKEINQEVKRRATLEGYTLVLDCSGRTANGISSVVFYQSSLDITDTVLRELNRGAGSK